jgi:hypothetical protein
MPRDGTGRDRGRSQPDLRAFFLRFAPLSADFYVKLSLARNAQLRCRSLVFIEMSLWEWEGLSVFPFVGVIAPADVCAGGGLLLFFKKKTV